MKAGEEGVPEGQVETIQEENLQIEEIQTSFLQERILDREIPNTKTSTLQLVMLAVNAVKFPSGQLLASQFIARIASEVTKA